MVVTAAGASQLDALRGVGDGRRTNAAPIIVAMAGKQKPTREVVEAVVHEFACQAAVGLRLTARAADRLPASGPWDLKRGSLAV